jgi:hypothetical protein
MQLNLCLFIIPDLVYTRTYKNTHQYFHVQATVLPLPNVNLYTIRKGKYINLT